MSISIAARYLAEGQLVAIPTETVYGLAANAYNEEAVKSVFKIKNRPFTDPLIVHVSSWEAAADLAIDIPLIAKELAEKFWPGPLTLLLPRSSKISPLITANQPLVAIRVPNHPLTLELLRNLDFPLVAPSANPFGYISPTTAAHVAAQLQDKIAYILDGGPCELGIESTIVGFQDDLPVIYRQGALPEEAIGRVIPGYSGYQGPGMLKSHYAPRKELILGDIPTLLKRYPDAAVLSFKTPYREPSFVLSSSGSLDEAAHNLFAAMRLLDGTNSPLIIAEKVPETGIGRAINDRLLKASCHKPRQ